MVYPQPLTWTWTVDELYFHFPFIRTNAIALFVMIYKIWNCKLKSILICIWLVCINVLFNNHYLSACNPFNNNSHQSHQKIIFFMLKENLLMIIEFIHTMKLSRDQILNITKKWHHARNTTLTVRVVNSFPSIVFNVIIVSFGTLDMWPCDPVFSSRTRANRSHCNCTIPQTRHRHCHLPTIIKDTWIQWLWLSTSVPCRF